MSNLVSNAHIFFSLLKRDLKIIKSKFLGIFIDNIIILAVTIILFGFLMPELGMPKELIAPIFIGNTVMTLFELGFSLGTKLVNDIKFNRFIDYQLCLPLSLTWLIAEYIVNFVIEACIFTLPLLALGIVLLGDKFIIYKTSWLAFSFMYPLVLVFFATLFLFFSFAYEYHWFFANIWARRLELLFTFGSVFIVWKRLYAFSKFWGTIFLLNPVTYATEGIRSTLIGGDNFLPFWICIIGVSIGIVINLFLLFPSMKRKLDHI